MPGSSLDKFALGTFAVEGNLPVIHYNPILLRHPSQLTATFAHELAHLIILPLGDPPGGEDLHEHATDCAAVYLGFGVFLANTARNFEQFQDVGMHGWRSNNSGYLSEQALVTLTALFIRLFSVAPDLVKGYLKPYLQTDFSKALKYIDWRCADVSAAIDEVDFADWR